MRPLCLSAPLRLLRTKHAAASHGAPALASVYIFVGLLRRSYEDVYGDPGTPLARRTKAGTYILAKVRLVGHMRLSVSVLWDSLWCLASAGRVFFFLG